MHGHLHVNIYIYIYIYIYICTNNILAVKEQYGFKIKSSTKAAYYNVINEILKAIFSDLEKVFDCVHQGIVVSKSELYVISGKCLTLIQSYLRERYQKVLTDKINAYDGVSSYLLTHSLVQSSS